MKKRRKTCEHIAEGSNQNRITKCSWCVNIRIKKNLLLDHILLVLFLLLSHVFWSIFNYALFILSSILVKSTIHIIFVTLCKTLNTELLISLFNYYFQLCRVNFLYKNYFTALVVMPVISNWKSKKNVQINKFTSISIAYRLHREQSHFIIATSKLEHIWPLQHTRP